MATPGFFPESSAGSRPQTPPYTPRRPKRPIYRSESPASIQSTIKADETTSPAKKATAREGSEHSGDFTVEELTEHDAGYIADDDVVYPNELEEVDSRSEREDESSTDLAERSADPEAAIAEQLSRLECADEAEVAFERNRREKRVSRRKDSLAQAIKRQHDLTVDPNLEVVDSDAMDDHDLPDSARRLRRRVRGPMDGDGDMYVSSPEPGSAGLAHSAGSSRPRTPHEAEGETRVEHGLQEAMDVDDDDDDDL